MYTNQLNKMMKNTYPIITWEDEFNTNIKEIDEQHMILVYLLNEVSAKLSSDNNQTLLLPLTEDLLAYALYHFETEEVLMQQYNYEHADSESMQKHINEHRNFSQQVLTVREQLKTNVKVEISEVLSFITDWLIDHILKTDQDLAKYLISEKIEF